MSLLIDQAAVVVELKVNEIESQTARLSSSPAAASKTDRLCL